MGVGPHRLRKMHCASETIVVSKGECDGFGEGVTTEPVLRELTSHLDSRL